VKSSTAVSFFSSRMHGCANGVELPVGAVREIENRLMVNSVAVDREVDVARTDRAGRWSCRSVGFRD
jgi:hypothetical protein